MDNASAQEMMAELKDYYDTLDEAYRAVDALGGYGCPKGKEEALERLLSMIFHMGGREAYARKKDGYPVFARPDDGDDGGPFFRVYMFRAGRTLGIADVADIQSVLNHHNDLIGEQTELHHQAYTQALLDIGGQELVDAHTAKQSARVDAVVAKVLEDFRAKRKTLS